MIQDDRYGVSVPVVLLTVKSNVMILILSNDGDLSSDLIQDWLEYYDHSYIRINSFDFLRYPVKICLNGTHIKFCINNEEIDIASIHSVLYRKYGFFRKSNAYKELCKTKGLSADLVNQINIEYNKVIELLTLSLRDRNWLTNPIHVKINKVWVLKLAAECGLDTPDTYVINKKDGVDRDKKQISKSIFDPIFASWKNKNKSMMYTVELTKNDIAHLPERFMPSMLQSMVQKEYELRIFYLCGRCYPMAIFSQKDKQTQLDFRRYNWDKPNRYIPYKLDTATKLNINKLMRKLNLNCGSIDMIKGKDGKLYFLEVNPTGQFGMVDFPCNYGLHKLVAEQLIKMDN